MKKYILLLALIIPMIALAQTEQKYLDPLPLKNGKICFNAQVKAPTLSQDDIYDQLMEWANERFKPDERMSPRVLYTDKQKGIIAIYGEEYIIFSSSALSLDRTRIYYQLQINCLPEKAEFEMTKIKYWYDESRNGGEKFAAEEWITDDNCMNKAKTKLYPISGKFRRKTIDLKDELIKTIQNKVGELLISKNSNNNTANTAAVTTVVATTTAEPAVSTQPIVEAPAAVTANAAAQQPAQSATKSQDEIIAAAHRITITSGNDEEFEINRECWGGFGNIFGKNVTFCIINTQKTMANMLLAQNDRYTISFFLPGNKQAALTIKCKKLSQQPLSGEEAHKMNSANSASASYNMFVGEVE